MAATIPPPNGAGKLTMWLLGALFTIALAAVGAYANAVKSDNSTDHAKIEFRLGKVEDMAPRVSALEAKVNQAFHAIETRLGGIDRKLDMLMDKQHVHYRPRGNDSDRYR